MKIGAITIGQAPRTDVTADILRIFDDSLELVQAGGLDGLTKEEIAEFAPGKDDYVLVDNGLKTVSPKIKASTVKATKTGFFLFSGGQKEKQTSNKQNFIKHFALFCFLLLPLYVVYLIYINEKKRRQKVKERRQARQMNN